PLPGADQRTRPGQIGRHRRPGPVPSHLSPARVGADRTQADEPAEPECNRAPVAAAHGGPRDRSAPRWARQGAAPGRAAGVRQAWAARNADRTGEPLRAVGRDALERAARRLARQRRNPDRSALRARVPVAIESLTKRAEARVKSTQGGGSAPLRTWLSTLRCSPLRRSPGWLWKRAVTMSMRHSGAAVTRRSFSRHWGPKAACLRSTRIRRALRAAP